VRVRVACWSVDVEEVRDCVRTCGTVSVWCSHGWRLKEVCRFIDIVIGWRSDSEGKLQVKGALQLLSKRQM